MRLALLLLSMTLCGGAAAAQDYQLDFDPSTFKGPASGPVNEVLVLGTAHLSQPPKGFKPEHLQPLMERLAAWRPQMISIEALSGPQCDFVRRYPRGLADTFKTYCWDTTPAQATTGLDVPAATVEAGKLLATWPATPTAAQRRRLAAVFLAGGERGSALVQWLRLSTDERRTGDGLDTALVNELAKLDQQSNERYLIAARLAARLGHERVYAMDDHTADSATDDDKAYGAALTKAWDNPHTALIRNVDKLLDEGISTSEGVMKLYRTINAPGRARILFDSDFGAVLNEPSPQRYGRNYVGYWETRNLRMAANIRDVLGVESGKRMLVVVGASHKGYLEAYLHQMHDVRIVDAGPVLR